MSLDRFLDDVMRNAGHEQDEDEEDDVDYDLEELEELHRCLPRYDLSVLKKRYRVPTEDIDSLKLKRNVILAYTDIAAGGSRALLGIDHRIQYYPLKVPALNCDKLRPVCIRDEAPRPTEQDFLPLQVLNCKYEEYSFIVINTIIPGMCCHLVIDRILDLIQESGSQRLYILTVLNFDNLSMYEHSIYEGTLYAKPVTDYPQFPSSAYIEDSLLITLIQMLLADQIPTTFFVIPGYRSDGGQANEWDGSRQIIALFQDTLHSLTRLNFSNKLSNSLLYKRQDEAKDEANSTIYI